MWIYLTQDTFGKHREGQDVPQRKIYIDTLMYKAENRLVKISWESAGEDLED